MSYIVSTERLGRPPDRRWILFGNRVGLPADPHLPGAACHLQSAAGEDALCGHEGEGLTAVPAAQTFDDIPAMYICEGCDRVSSRREGRTPRWTLCERGCVDQPEAARRLGVRTVRVVTLLLNEHLTACADCGRSYRVTTDSIEREKAWRAETSRWRRWGRPFRDLLGLF